MPYWDTIRKVRPFASTPQRRAWLRVSGWVALAALYVCVMLGVAVWWG